VHNDGLRGDLMRRISAPLRATTAQLVRDHIQANLDQKMSCASLADLAELSQPHFCRAFKATFGSTFRRYVQLVRLRRACHLMSATQLTLIEISYECGMADQAHFCNCFRERFGMSPGQWRRESIEGVNR
jgi:AraC family transcriptional regulator